MNSRLGGVNHMDIKRFICELKSFFLHSPWHIKFRCIRSYLYERVTQTDEQEEKTGLKQVERKVKLPDGLNGHHTAQIAFLRRQNGQAADHG
jgi:2-oxo-4-hydroxy-4-carboxy--5-ureidoimidazoline (OHCU) decarboxylase